MDKRNTGILALSFVAIFFCVLPSDNRAMLSLTYPSKTENWAAIFRGYEAYLENEINYPSISGTSMAPTFCTDDTILWVKFPIENLRAGDIIVYKHPTVPDHPRMAHRVYHIASPGSVQPKGDNLPTADKYHVTSEYYEGLVIRVLFTSSGMHK